MSRARLDDARITEGLTALRGWVRDGDKLVRTVRFDAYLRAVDALVKIANAAEAANHHPDLLLSWTELTIGLSTHDAGGITLLDLDLAEQIDGVLASYDV